MGGEIVGCMCKAPFASKERKERRGFCGCQKRSFEAAFKLKVVQHVDQHSNRAAARMFGIDKKHVHEWKIQSEQLKTLPQKKRRL